MSKPDEHYTNDEMHIESNVPSDETASLTITGVPASIHRSPEKIHQLLDLLELPKGTRVTISTKASTSIVR
jgi:hypothetical protein